MSEMNLETLCVSGFSKIVLQFLRLCISEYAQKSKSSFEFLGHKKSFGFFINL